MVCEVVGLQFLSASFSPQGTEGEHTLKLAEYGIPIGILANTASARFSSAFLNARLWLISWMARNRFWFAVAPMMYAVPQKRRDQKGVFCRL